MNEQKIKSYDELNTDEHYVLDMFRTMKIECDKARFQLWRYELDDLINSYGELKKLREDIRVKYFAMLEKIDASEFAEVVDVDYGKWDTILTNENNEWTEELELMSQFKYHLDGLLLQLNDGTIEQMIIEDEKNIA